jgi:hypothetical protein
MLKFYSVQRTHMNSPSSIHSYLTLLNQSEPCVLVKIPRVQSTELPSASTSDGYGGLSMGDCQVIIIRKAWPRIIVGNVFEVCNRLERRPCIVTLSNLSIFSFFLPMVYRYYIIQQCKKVQNKCQIYYKEQD